MPTIHSVLRRPNPELDRSRLISGGNTITPADIQPECWREWNDFNYLTLTKIFHRQLSSDYTGPDNFPDRILPRDLQLRTENSVDYVLRHKVVDPVNWCLDQSGRKPHLGMGDRCVGKGDWSLVVRYGPDSSDESDLPVNILAGDTKVSSKFYPEMTNAAEWQKVLAQVLGYMADCQTRYGFIATDEHFFALRLTRKRMGEGIAADHNRPRRHAAPAAGGHERQISDASTLSDVSTRSGNTSGQESSYVDNNARNFEYRNPELKIIPYDHDGKKKTLNMKEGFYFMSMLATYGDRHLDYEYPPLNSWCVSPDGGYVHTTNGEKKDALAPGDVLWDPSQQEPAGEEQAPEEGVSLISLLSDGLARMRVGGEEEEEEDEDEDGDQPQVEAPRHSYHLRPRGVGP
ncbi:hypothetical protein F5X97DRAFT_340435 [Nemania serpens]|nr:hypothetical protein F5X97DRAFT_340435 [Nemania serpens]